MSADSLAALRARLAGLSPPLVVFNKSHSGSRLLGRALSAHGIHMGAELNDSHDALPMLPVVERLVEGWYPDYAPLWRDPAAPCPELVAAIETALGRHLQGYDLGTRRPWGWKLCETAYILPVLDYLFPAARYIHLVRDGRDVAFCDHVPPIKPFWRRIYFNTDRIADWQGRPLTRAAYERASHVFNALHWRNSVEIGRAYGAMLRERCLELRYEALCADFAGTMAQALAHAGLAADPAAIDSLLPEVHGGSIGKHRRQSRRQQRQVLAILAPTLASFGYVEEPRRGLLWRPG